MKKIFLILLVFSTIHLSAQPIFGYWYGNANVKTNTSANNYLVELIVQPEKGYVKAVINYYFKASFRSLMVKGNYDPKTRQLNLYNVPMTYFGSIAGREIDCMMNLVGTLRASKVGSTLTGSFLSLPQYKYVCSELKFSMKLDAGVGKQDSVLKAIREFKEEYQVWKPSMLDTEVAANIIQRKVTNYVIENEYKEREKIVSNEITVEGDSVKVDFYDSGEVDGDSVSVFFNDKLLAYHQFLSTRSVHFELGLDTTLEVNELAMFADNLGSIPPNTALMQVYDGNKRYDIRMSSSFDKSAVLRIRRKK